MALGAGVGLEDVLVGRYQEAGGSAGGIEHGLILLGVQDRDDEINDVARGAELPGIALGAEHREQVLECIAQSLGVIVGELIDDLEEGAKGLWIAVG